MDEDLTGRLGDFTAGLALFREASAPAPSPELAALFAAPPVIVTSAPPTPRRAPVYKRILAGIPAKVAAGALGALLAGTVGAGAMTGTISLASSESDAPAVEAPAVDDAPPVVADDAEPPAADVEEHDAADVEEHDTDEADEVAVDEVDDDGANDAAADADLAAVPVPTSVDEAAHTHDFDEACGNHGAYVSAFAHTGTEPDCAVQARAAASGDQQASDDSDATAAADATATPESSAEPVQKAHGSGNGKASATGGNWQLTKADKGGKGAKSDKGTKSKGGR